MKLMKRILACTMSLALLLTMLAACGGGTTTTEAPEGSDGESGEKRTLTVVNWQDYGSNIEQFVTQFEEENNCTIVHVPMSSEQELLTKLRTSEAGEYDVVLPNCMILETAAAEGLLEPIDPASLSNWENMNPRFQEQAECWYEDQLYSVPWVWGSTAIAYNTDHITEPPTSINVLFDEQYAGHIAMNDDTATAIGTAALALGQDPNAPTDLEAIKAKLIEQKPLNYAYWTTGDEFSKIFVTGEVWVALMWSGQTAQMMQEGQPIAYTVPEDGAFGWVDTWGIPSNSENKDLALKFIDMMISEEFQSYWVNAGGPAPVNQLSIDALDPEYAASIGADDESLGRLSFTTFHSDEELITWNELWTEAKAS